MEEKKIYISTAGATTGYCEFHFLREIQREARLLEEELRQMGQHYGNYDNVTVIVINAIESRKHIYLAPSVVKFRADVIAKTLFQSEEILGTYRVKMKQRLSIRPFDITEGCPWDYDGDD
jgi:hypothetical protein